MVIYCSQIQTSIVWDATTSHQIVMMYMRENVEHMPMLTVIKIKTIICNFKCSCSTIYCKCLFFLCCHTSPTLANEHYGGGCFWIIFWKATTMYEYKHAGVIKAVIAELATGNSTSMHILTCLQQKLPAWVQANRTSRTQAKQHAHWPFYSRSWWWLQNISRETEITIMPEECSLFLRSECVSGTLLLPI